MRTARYFLLAGLSGMLAACTFPLSQKRVVRSSVYDHVSCRTPGARREEPIDLGATSRVSDPTKAKSGSAKSRSPTCVIERSPGYNAR